MNKHALSLAVFVAGVYPVASNALSLGDIESNSNLNQPLRARIELLSTNAQEAKQLQVRLAPTSVFNRVGIDRPNFLNNLRFSPTMQNGKPVIMVTSDAPIEEPFVNFLVEVSWPQGQLLKEYTIMLDPPVLMQAGNTMSNEAAVRAEPSAVGTVARPRSTPAVPRTVQPQRPVAQQPQNPPRQAAPTPRPQVAEQATPRPQAVAHTPRRTYRVRSGDTLYGIAARVRQPQASTEQMMMAMYRANPKAFINDNINGLKKGSLLRSPNMNLVQDLSAPEAARQVKQQYKDWESFRMKLAGNTAPQRAVSRSATTRNNNAARPAPARNATNNKARLEVLGSNQNATPATNATAAAGKQRLQELEQQLTLAKESLTSRQRENDELKSRLTDLESMLSKKNRLIALRDSQLAELQKTVGGGQVPATADVNTPPVNEVQNAGVVNNTVMPTPPTVDANVNNLNNNVPTPPTVDANVSNGMPPSLDPNMANSQPVVPAPNMGDDLRNAQLQQNDAIVRAQPENVNPAVQPVDQQVNPSAFVDGQSTGNDLLSMLTSPLALKIGGGALGSLLLLGLLSRLLGRRRKDKVVDDDQADAVFDIHEQDKNQKIEGADVFANLETDIKRAERKQQDLVANSHDEHFVDTEAWGNDGHSTHTAEHIEEPASHEEDEDDVLMESNVYIAYGLHQQAESELKKAIEKYPERLEYRHKLLENYFAANNREAFDSTAKEFEAQGGRNRGKLWDDVMSWGKKISPDNPLYRMKADSVVSASTVAASVAGVTAPVLTKAEHDDELHNALHELSNSLDHGVTANHDDLDAHDLDLDLDLDMPSTKPSAGTQKAAVGLDDLDNDLSDLDFDPAKFKGNAASVTQTNKNNVLDELDDLDFSDLLDDQDHKLDLALDTPRAANKGGVLDSVADAAGAMVSKVKDNAGIAAAAVAGAGALAAKVIGGAKSATNTVGTEVKGALNNAQEALMVDDDADFDLTNLLDDHQYSAPASKPVVDKVTNLELHIRDKDLNKILPEDNFYTKSGVAAADGGKSSSDEWLGDIDDALSFLDLPDEEIDLHEAHISTKLDLARAYLDMGDVEGARSTLEEVMVEGNDDQRREAETLLHQAG